MKHPMPRTRYDEFSRAYPRTLAIVQDLIGRKGVGYHPASADEFTSHLAKDEITTSITEMLAVLCVDNGLAPRPENIMFLKDRLVAQRAMETVFEVFSADMLMACRFLSMGSKTYYFTDNLTARLAATRLNAPCEAVRLPFPTCQFVFDGPAIQQALNFFHQTTKNSPTNTRPLSLYISETQKADYAQIGFVGSQRGDKAHHVGTYIARSLRLEPGRTVEDALKTQWPDGPQAEWRNDAAFLAEGMALQRIILNAVLYLNSSHPDVSDLTRAIGSPPKPGSARKERRAHEYAMRFETGLSYIPVGLHTPPISDASGNGVALADRILVAGHWKAQPYGPGRALRRQTHIDPYYRGPDMAELVNKPHIVS